LHNDDRQLQASLPAAVPEPPTSPVAQALPSLGIEIRAGLHSGECETLGTDLGGIAVHIGSRVADMANAGEILVSSTVKDLVVGSGICFEDRGLHTFKGAPGEWRLYVVGRADEVIE
jgi:class 3 adenylate cyclase